MGRFEQRTGSMNRRNLLDSREIEQSSRPLGTSSGGTLAGVSDVA